MTRGFAIAIVLLTVLLHAAVATTAPSRATRWTPISPTARERKGACVASRSGRAGHNRARRGTTGRAGEDMSANPLWGIPLTQLSVTRDRRSSRHRGGRRRPGRRTGAGPAATAASEEEITPPQLSLSHHRQRRRKLRHFSRSVDQAALRLRVGDDYQAGDCARSRPEVTIEKDQQGAVLTLPEPGEASSGEIRLYR